MNETGRPRRPESERLVPRPPAPDDLATCLARAVARLDRPALLLTLSAAPAGNLLPHIFGVGATANLIVGDAPGQLRLKSPEGGSGAWPSEDIHAVVARIVDAPSFERLAARARRKLERASAVITAFSLLPRHRQALTAMGFHEAHAVAGAGRENIIFLRSDAPFPPAIGDTRQLARPRMRRLVIVDPCLGGAEGHYQGYARMLTQGALDFGVDVVWGCHAAFDAGLALPEVAVRRCFRRSFFDLTGESVGAIDLSSELLEGWIALLREFDAPDTHFLVHSADAHQLRAVVALLAQRPAPRSTIHINFQTSPRFMPGRLAGIEVHRAVATLRTTPLWGGSLFFWAETRRLGLWLSQWLGADIPALPFLVPSRLNSRADETRPVSAPTLSFLGEGRPTKGFLDLPAIADAIADDLHLRSKLRLVIQNWRPFRGDAGLHDRALARVSAHSFVEIVEGVLDPDTYMARLRQADLLLLPYDPATYDLQGSGILVEGFANGSIIVARAGMAVEDEAAHGVIFTFRKPGDLVDVLTDILADFDNLVELARSKAERFRNQATASRYIAALDSRA